MVKFPIPLTGQEVDTDDGASGVGMSYGLAILAMTSLAAVAGVGTFAFNRIRDAAGVEEVQIPGV